MLSVHAGPSQSISLKEIGSFGFYGCIARHAEPKEEPCQFLGYLQATGIRLAAI